MDRKTIANMVRSNTRDFANTLFRHNDIVQFINEGIDRLRSIPELNGMTHLEADEVEPSFLPSQYHYLLAVYATARCFAQDENEYKATTFMNEFEVKMDELRNAIDNGEVTITDENGDIVESAEMDYVRDVYFR